MPTYDYQCRSCGTVTEIIHSMLEDGPTTCENCGGALRRVFYPTGIIFKGSGFYSTDSRARTDATKGESGEKVPSSSSSSSSSDGGGTSSSSDGGRSSSSSSDGGRSSSSSSDGGESSSSSSDGGESSSSSSDGGGSTGSKRDNPSGTKRAAAPER